MHSDHDGNHAGSYREQRICNQQRSLKNGFFLFSAHQDLGTKNQLEDVMKEYFPTNGAQLEKTCIDEIQRIVLYKNGFKYRKITVLITLFSNFRACPAYNASNKTEVSPI